LVGETVRDFRFGNFIKEYVIYSKKKGERRHYNTFPPSLVRGGISSALSFVSANLADDFNKKMSKTTFPSPQSFPLRGKGLIIKAKKGIALPLFPKERTKRRNYSPYMVYRHIWRIT
jgi:hypothetical protein